MLATPPSKNKIIERILLALIFTAVGGFIIVVFDPWEPIPAGSRTADYLGKLAACAVLLAAAISMRRSRLFHQYWQVCLALFILCFAISLDWIFAIYLVEYLSVNVSSPAGLALQKLNDCLVILSVVIAFTRLSGESLGSIYLQKGKLKQGLIIGLGTFALAAAGSIPMAELMFNAQNLSLARALPWIPWVLLAVLANASLEEILFRGLFLRKLAPFLGEFAANFLVALVFTVLHRGATYTPAEYVFLAVLVPLALLWGYIMQKTDSALASILFHAGMDIPVFLGIFANL